MRAPLMRCRTTCSLLLLLLLLPPMIFGKISGLVQTNIRRHQASFVPRHRRAAKETGGSLTHDRKISTAQEDEKHGRRLKENKFAVQVTE